MQSDVLSYGESRFAMIIAYLHFGGKSVKINLDICAAAKMPPLAIGNSMKEGCV